jgi:hypothetical protein
MLRSGIFNLTASCFSFHHKNGTVSAGIWLKAYGERGRRGEEGRAPAKYENIFWAAPGSALRCLFNSVIRACSMIEKPFTQLTKRAYNLGFRQGYEIANRTPIDENISKDEFVNRVYEAVIHALESTVFKYISAELDSMNAKYPAFDGWKVFAAAINQGAGENFLDRTGNKQ